MDNEIQKENERKNAFETLKSCLEDAQNALALEEEKEDGPTQEQLQERAEKRRDEWEKGILTVNKELVRKVVLRIGGPHIEIRAHYIPSNFLKSPTRFDNLNRAEIVYISRFCSPPEEISIEEDKYPDLWEWLEMLGKKEVL